MSHHYATEAERIEARRRSYRESKARCREFDKQTNGDGRMSERLCPRWMDTATAAEYICRAAGTLENWRYASDPDGPPWFPGKGSKPCYDRLALDAWMEGLKKAAS